MFFCIFIKKLWYFHKFTFSGLPGFRHGCQLSHWFFGTSHLSSTGDFSQVVFTLHTIPIIGKKFDTLFIYIFSKIMFFFFFEIIEIPISEKIIVFYVFSRYTKKEKNNWIFISLGSYYKGSTLGKYLPFKDPPIHKSWQ